MQPDARWPNAGAGFPWQNSLLPLPSNAGLGDWSCVDSAGYDANNQNTQFCRDEGLFRKPSDFPDARDNTFLRSRKPPPISTSHPGFCPQHQCSRLHSSRPTLSFSSSS